MNWSYNYSNPFNSQSMESKFDCPIYDSYSDRLLYSQNDSSKPLSSFDHNSDKYHDPISEFNYKYSSLDSPDYTRIWTDIDKSQTSDSRSWGIMFPDHKPNWNYDAMKNKDLSSSKMTDESLSLHTLSAINLDIDKFSYDTSVSSPCKKTWALIVGRQNKLSSAIPVFTAHKTDNKHITGKTPQRTNCHQIDINPKKARFFVIKSYSEDDVYRSIKYQIWCSTEKGNRRLDSAYQQSGSEMPIYLFFSVNGSGHFCGVAEMVGAVDYNAQTGVWAQGKWRGQFPVRWSIVKDVPNSHLRHIRIETNENKPVTNSRDVTEIPLEQGRQVLKIITAFMTMSSIYDDFDHYKQREISELNS